MHPSRTLFALSAAALLAAMASGCTHNSTASPTGDASAAPVVVAKAESREVPLVLRAIGWVEAVSSVTMKPQISGRLTEVRFSEGQLVKKGDVLFRLDDRPFIAQRELAQANLVRDRALLADAASEFKRVHALFERKVAAERENEHAQALFDAQRAAVNADEAALENARLREEYCTIRSPVDGRVGSRMAFPGTIVKENETELVVLNQMQPIYARFSVAEMHLDTIRKYLARGRLEVEAQPKQNDATVVRGTLAMIDNAVDQQTGMVRLKAEFANENEQLWPGRFVQVGLVLSREPGRVVVPTSAVQAGQHGQFVYVIRPDQTADMRTVRVGRAYEGGTIIEEGVRAGETVVTDGQLRLVPGSHVQARAASSQPARSAT